MQSNTKYKMESSDGKLSSQEKRRQMSETAESSKEKNKLMKE